MQKRIENNKPKSLSNRELKNRHFWATDTNWKSNFLFFGMHYWLFVHNIDLQMQNRGLSNSFEKLRIAFKTIKSALCPWLKNICAYGYGSGSQVHCAKLALREQNLKVPKPLHHFKVYRNKICNNSTAKAWGTSWSCDHKILLTIRNDL